MSVYDIICKLRTNEISHPAYALAYSKLYSHSAFAQPGNMLIMLGPSRVGKTRISLKLEKELLAIHRTDTSDMQPILRIDASTTDQGFISTKYLTLRCLIELRHPFYVDPDASIRLSASESKLRAQLLLSLRSRQTKYLVIDEAHHLIRQKNNRTVHSVLDSFKCLGNEAQIVIILIGGYELAPVCTQSAHFNSRLTLIDFPNYKIDPESLHQFDRLLASIDELLPWAKGDSLITHRELIYDGTQGCYGAVLQWVSSALAELHARQQSVLKIAHFKATRFEEQVRPVRLEIQLGEQYFNEIAGNDEQSAIPSPKSKRSHRPFTRKPKRDPVK